MDDVTLHELLLESKARTPDLQEAVQAMAKQAKAFEDAVAGGNSESLARAIGALLTTSFDSAAASGLSPAGCITLFRASASY